MGRYYKDHKKRDVPSVTTITGQISKADGLIQWAANSTAQYVKEKLGITECIGDTEFSFTELKVILDNAPKHFRTLSSEALDIGSEAHKMIEDYLQGEEVDTEHPQVRSAFNSFLEWAELYNPEPIEVEKVVFGDKFAGTCDFLGYLTIKGERKLYVVDWKTSKAVYKDYSYQIAAYRSAIPDVEGCGILRIDKNEPEKWQWKDTSRTYEKDLEVFDKLTELWWLMHPRKHKQYVEKK